MCALKQQPHKLLSATVSDLLLDLESSTSERGAEVDIMSSARRVAEHAGKVGHDA
jgi:hypothetical protein